MCPHGCKHFMDSVSKNLFPLAIFWQGHPNLVIAFGVFKAFFCTIPYETNLCSTFSYLSFHRSNGCFGYAARAVRR